MQFVKIMAKIMKLAFAVLCSKFSKIASSFFMNKTLVDYWYYCA